MIPAKDLAFDTPLACTKCVFCLIGIRKVDQTLVEGKNCALWSINIPSY